MTIPYHIIVGGGTAKKVRAEQEIAKTFHEIDLIFNKYNPTSEVSHLNRWADATPFHCSPQLFSMLILCDKIVSITKGRFDPTVEPLEEAWKGALEKGHLPDAGEIASLRPALGWKQLTLRDGYVVKNHPLTAVDLGGVAKGYAVDLLVERLTHLGFHSVYVEWGGEIKTHGQHPDGRPWRVGICHPKSQNSALQVLETEDTALATSGDYHQYWSIEVSGEKKLFFHVFDQEAGEPLVATPSSLVSVTVQHESCCIADALAKTFLFARDKEEATQMLQEQILPFFPTVRTWMFSHEEASTLS